MATVGTCVEKVQDDYGQPLRGTIPAEVLAAIASELSSLPPSDDPIPLGGTVVILGYSEHGIWMTRIYERSRLGPRVKRLADIVGLDLK